MKKRPKSRAEIRLCANILNRWDDRISMRP